MNIDCPINNDTDAYNVTVSDTGRTMAANGTFSNEQGAVVKARVFCGHLTFDIGDPRISDPSTPDAQSAPAQLATTSANAWWICDLNVPSLLMGSGFCCGSGSPATGYPMTVVAWEVGDKEFSTIPRIAHIIVKEDEGKFCGRGDGSGGSGPCGSGGSQNASQSAQSSVSVALTTAPLVWGLLTAGLEIGRSFLNGPLALNFRDGTGGFCVWDNGGDGEQTPHVELRCESPMVTAWRLTIRQGSEAPVEYVRSAAEWNPLTSNVIYRAAKAEATSPEQLTLIPG